MLVKITSKLGDGDEGNPAGVWGGGAGPASSHSGPEVSWTSSKAVGGAAAAVPAGAWPWPRYKGAGCQLGQTSRWPNGKSASPLACPIDAGCRVEPGLSTNGKICGPMGRGGLPRRQPGPLLRTGRAKGGRASLGLRAGPGRARPCTGPSRGPAYSHPHRVPRSQGPWDARLGAGAALRSCPRCAPGRLGPGGGARRG